MTDLQFSNISETVKYAVDNDVAVIEFCNPPVNGLSASLRIGLENGLDRAVEDPAVRAIVLVGDPAGKGFCGGADLRELNTEKRNEGPGLLPMLTRMEGLDKPVIAAIHGFALGGGLELALGCHYRVAEVDARLGLPEVNLGLLPGGGGTQRLPRLIGAATALSLISSAAPVNGTEAARLGIVDESFDGDPIAAGIAFARTKADASEHPVISRTTVADSTGADFAGARAAIRPSTRNGRALHAAINCVEASTTLPFAESMEVEQSEFRGVLASPEAAALQHVFFAEKEALKVDDVPKDTPTRPVDKVAVLGAGTMGGGIAMVFANAGIPVTLIEQAQEALDRGVATMQKNYDITAAKGKLTAAQVTERMGRITPSLDLQDAADADLIIEAVFEDMAVKQEIFSKLDAIAKAGAILATNTSRLDIDQIAASTSRPQDVIGLHFFSPANVMRLLEVVRGAKTAPDVISTSMKLAPQIAKLPVLARICEGFIGNRMLTPYRREGEFMLEEGASPAQVDGALKNFGMAMGPFAMSDLAGLDIMWAARKRQASTRPPHQRYSVVADQLCEAGRFGQKTGAGFYRYDAGSRTPQPDPAVETIIEQAAVDAGIDRREVTDEEIVDRCILALVNEGAKLLDEGIAQRASDIDAVYVNGYGFPAFRGGPMFWAQQQGLDVALAKIENFYEQHGEFWTPAPLLQRLVAEGKTTF